MFTHFSQEFFIANRQKLRLSVKNKAPIVITANGLLQRGGDSPFRFAQDANFWYLTGINEPDIILVIEAEDEYLIVRPRDESRVAFDGAVDDEALTGRSGIGTVFDHTAGWERLNRQLHRIRMVNTIPAPLAYMERYGLYTNPARAALLDKIKSDDEQVEVNDISVNLVQARMIKQRQELVAIRQAIDITAKALQIVASPERLRKYRFEYEIEADIAYAFRRGGAAGHAFDPIVAGGIRACTLHNVSNEGQFALHDVVVMDVGAEVENYAADITRSYSLLKPYRRQSAVYRAVKEVQDYAFSLLKPGVFLKEYEALVEVRLGEALRGLNLLRTIDRASVRRYCPHAISHFLGLNVHDVGDYELPLQPGMVITVEPGIYIPDEKLGIRIEDDVLITDNGIEVLSVGLPRKLG